MVNLLQSADDAREDEEFVKSSDATPNVMSKPKDMEIAVSSLDDSP